MLPDNGNGPKEKVSDGSLGSMEAQSAIRHLLHAAGAAGPGRVHVRHIGLGRAAGRLRRRRRPVAQAARERGQHVLGLPAAVRELEPGPAQRPGGSRGGGPRLVAAQVRRDLVHRPDRGRQGSAHGHTRGRDRLEGRLPDDAGRRGRLPRGAAAEPVRSAVDDRARSASGRAGSGAGGGSGPDRPGQERPAADHRQPGAGVARADRWPAGIAGGCGHRPPSGGQHAGAAPPRPVGRALLLLADESVARSSQARWAMGRPRQPAGLTGNRPTGGRPERAS